MLWMAMAMAMLMPSLGLERAPTKVAKPSGKLWMAIARAENKPVRSKVCDWALGKLASGRVRSWLGRALSIKAITTMPAKNASTVTA